MRAALYVRVSTGDQSTGMQEAALGRYAKTKKWQVTKVYRDVGFSGMSFKRPGLSELMKDCRRRRCDVVLVWKFDRFARSVEQLAAGLTEFEQLGINFVSLTESIDTTTSGGRMIFYVMAALAAFERDLIRERVRAGLENARRRGVQLGRRPKKLLDASERKEIRQQYRAGGITMRGLATQHHTSVWMIHRVVNAGV